MNTNKLTIHSVWLDAGPTVKCCYCSSILLAETQPTSIFQDNIYFKKKSVVSLRPGSLPCP